MIIVSSLFLNTPIDINAWWFADKVFTVYTKDYIEEHHIEINCGAKACLRCMLCYKHNDVKYINEVLK